MCDRCVAAIASPPAILLGARNGAPSLTALGPYDGALRSAVLAMKFRGARSIGDRLGRWLSPKIIFPFEAIVPVPLHRLRLRERGYNQAGEIARGIAAATRKPCVDDALERVRATAPQSSLDLADRKGNVDGAFAYGRRIERVAGLRVLIVDDVVTSGATMRACAVVLHAAGVRTLYSAAAAVRL
jgi:ComF family protein